MKYLLSTRSEGYDCWLLHEKKSCAASLKNLVDLNFSILQV